MSDWTVVPCLLALRGEFNAVAPGRDKGADGTIGDSSHTSSSDHSGDEDSDILRDHDADSKNEVHALDIDSSGPWPAGFDFVERIRAIKAREFARGAKSRLQYVICNRQIANKDIQGGAWRTYSGEDSHTNHAHFSARYTTAQENDTSSWGVADGIEGDMAAADDLIEITESTAKRIGKKAGDKVSLATLVQLGVIYGKDGADRGTAAVEAVGAQAGKLTTLESGLAALAARLDRLDVAVSQVDEQTAARVFEGSNTDVIGVLGATLGQDRLKAIASQILGA